MGGVKPDWLAQLAPAHALAPPGIWPLAPGWWVLAILFVLALVTLAYRYNRPAMRLRRAAFRELDRLEATITSDMEFARALEHLLRRYAVSRFGRAAVARLTGEQWLNFIVEHNGVAFSGDAGASLLRAAWGGTAGVDRTPWISGARTFIGEPT